MAQGSFDRAEALRRLRSTEFDVLVVGGGVIGCGVAVDAASRGLRTALVERADFASGTSSRSTQLIHGGVGHLRQHEVGLARQSLVERERLRRNAPHLVSDLPVVVPLLAGDEGREVRRRGWRSLLWLHDVAGGWRSGGVHHRVEPADVLGYAPTFEPGLLTGGFLLHGARADDARLTLNLARTAALDLGAVVTNQVEAVEMCRDHRGHLRGVRVRPAGQPPFEIACRWVVNAAGVWVGEVAGLPGGVRDAGRLSVRLTKGVHISVRRELLPVDAAVAIPAPDEDHVVAVVPWGSTHTYIGTTRTEHADLAAEPRCTRADVDHLLGAVNRHFSARLTPDQVSGTWAGLRPVPAPMTIDQPGPARSDIGNDGNGNDGNGNDGNGNDGNQGARRGARDPFEHHVVSVADGVVSVLGGELTGYRRVAADVVDVVVERLDPRTLLRVRRRSNTRQLRLRGAAGWTDARDGVDLGRAWPETLRHHLADRYGSEARTVLAMIERRPELGRPLVEGLQYLRAEAVYAARYEMAASLSDVLERRTRARLLERDATAEAAADCAQLIGQELGWDARRQAAEVAELREDVAEERRALRSAAPEYEVR